MRRVHRDRRQKQIQFFFAVFLYKSPGLGVELLDSENADSVLRQQRLQALVPTLVLVIDELMSFFRQPVAFLEQRETVGPSLGITVLDLWDPLESTCRHASLSIL